MTHLRETVAARRRRVRRIVSALRRAYPGATCALRHSTALELLVATILSAQCMDVRVNQVTEALFRKYRGAAAYAKADLRELERDIRSTGFYRNKAKNINAMAVLLMERFKGEVPSTMEQLTELPGVARKTANVVLGTWFGTADGIVVDTHVDRISHRLGLTTQKDPEKIERDLMELIPRGDWIQFSHAMIWHGRKVCEARRPACGECPLSKLCPSAGTFHVERPAAARRASGSLAGRTS